MKHTGSRKKSPFAIFRNRSFTLLWTGQLISSIGSALTTLAASVLVYRETGSTLSVGLMLIATSGPTIAIGLLAGVFVDRYDRKRIMLSSDLLRAILIFLIPSLIHLHLNWLYVVVALTSGISQFFDSAHASVLPEVASDEELASANALMSISSIGSQVLGFAAAGFIVASLSVEWAFYLDAVSFMVSALLIIFTILPAQPAIESTSISAVGKNLLEGLRVVTNTPVLKSLFLIAGPIFLLIGFQNTLLLPFALHDLHGTEFDFGLQQAAEAIGIAVGSLFMARLADRIREGQWLVLSYVAMALFSIWYSFAHSITLGIFLTGMIGLVNTPSYIGRQLIIQRATPREARGRVNSAFFVVRDVTFVLGMSLAGLADLFNVRMMLLYSSYLFLAVGLLVLILPGLAQPTAQWKRTFALLKGAEAAPRLGAGKPATMAEVERFISHIPALAVLNPKERTQLVAETLVAEAPGGKIVTYRGEISNMAYFILKGSVGEGYIHDEEYVILNYFKEGDFFGELAALTGLQRTVNIIAEEDSEFLIIPSKTMQRLVKQHEELRSLLYTNMAEHLSIVELPHGINLDQQLLRELRTARPETVAVSAMA